VYSLCVPNWSLKGYRNPLILVALIVCLLLCIGIVFSENRIHGDEFAKRINTEASTMTPTKWWIKSTATSLVPATAQVTIRISPESLDHNCTDRLRIDLTPNIYAYVSLGQVPNRVRSSAMLSAPFLGQIWPGEGLRVIDGPICADGYTWWLVESNQGNLRGWSVEGDGNEQWILPCPNEQVACIQQATVVPTETPVPNQMLNNVCQSKNLAAGMLALVKQDSILILRTQPGTGEIIGRAGPMATLRIVEGPICSDNTVWWKVDVGASSLSGWTAENNLQPCSREDGCKPGD
jgi:hypothetical protein